MAKFFIVLRDCVCAKTVTPGYVGANGHVCALCEGNLSIECKVQKVIASDEVLATVDEPAFGLDGEEEDPYEYVNEGEGMLSAEWMNETPE